MHLIIKIISATSFISALGSRDYFYYFFWPWYDFRIKSAEGFLQRVHFNANAQTSCLGKLFSLWGSRDRETLWNRGLRGLQGIFQTER